MMCLPLQVQRVSIVFPLIPLTLGRSELLLHSKPKLPGGCHSLLATRFVDIPPLLAVSFQARIQARRGKGEICHAYPRIAHEHGSEDMRVPRSCSGRWVLIRRRLSRYITQYSRHIGPDSWQPQRYTEDPLTHILICHKLEMVGNCYGLTL